MESKSIFQNPNIDFQMLNQSNNFEDACSHDDVQGFLSPSIKPLSKVASWHAFPSLEPQATPDATPQNSPCTNRKIFGNAENPSLDKSGKRWFNSYLFSSFGDLNLNKITKLEPADNSGIRKSNSQRNVSNFDINAVGPTSF